MKKSDRIEMYLRVALALRPMLRQLRKDEPDIVNAPIFGSLRAALYSTFRLLTIDLGAYAVVQYFQSADDPTVCPLCIRDSLEIVVFEMQDKFGSEWRETPLLDRFYSCGNCGEAGSIIELLKLGDIWPSD